MYPSTEVGFQHAPTNKKSFRNSNLPLLSKKLADSRRLERLKLV